MPRKRLLWSIFPAYLLLILLALLAVTLYFSHVLARFSRQQARSDLEGRARLVAMQVAGRLHPAQGAALESLCRRLEKSAGVQVTLFLPDGSVLADSRRQPAALASPVERPEVRRALAGKVGFATRYSQVRGEPMLYVALPVRGAAGVAGVVRTALPAAAVDRALGGIYLKILFGALSAALLAALMSLLLSRRLSRPLEEIRRGARRFAEGDLTSRLQVDGSEEIAQLAEAMNEMAAQLDDRIRTIMQQRNEQEAVLASMVEGVLAVDAGERVLRLNQAAARLLGVRPLEVQGRRIEEVVRKADVLRFVARALASREPVEGDIVLRDAGERFLQAHGTPLRGSRGQDIGVLIVLNDVTRLRRLENVRRDFVANVSHELKTPITAIKGSIETLLGGAMEEGATARRFLDITLKQTGRLHAIVEDLLDLSRIEQGMEGQGWELYSRPLRPVLEAALQACEPPSRDKEVRLELDCPAALRARLHAPLLEQAVVNLLTNAIKYSEPGGRVLLRGEAAGDRVAIRVQDAGCGISAEHLPRIFERFYRVDKARSRKLGGTGLGLAIVKHIAQAHGGEVTVASTPGEGSLFSILLPAEEPAP